MSSHKKFFNKALKVLLFSVIFIIIVGVLMFFSIYFSSNLDKTTIVVKKAEIELYDNDSTLIVNNELYKYIPYEKISPNVINAFIALEDKRFYTHKGIDYYRLLGALINNVKSLSFKEGGSTITQQLAKNTQLNNEKTLKRKIKEMRIARQIEKNYTKNQILEMYLNAIYYGNGIYGIDSACRNYFNKSPTEISISEGAILAGIVKNPQKYSPKNNPNLAIKRRNLVLSLMKEQNFISETQYSQALKESYVQLEKSSIKQSCTPYYLSAISEASKLLGISEKELIKKNYKIYTYYDVNQQKSLANVLNSEKENSFASIICDNATGGISAYYSNVETDIFENRRQPASTIKPFIAYLPAIEYGLITPETMVFDEKPNINGYAPENHSKKYVGWTTVKTALSSSINSVSVSLVNELGVHNAIDFAKKFGLTFDKNDYNLSTSLGGLTYGFTLNELTSAYMCIANGGIYKENSFIKKIVDSTGKIIYANNNIGNRVISEDTAYLITDMLMNTVSNGTAKKLQGLDFQIASKTGTAQSANSTLNTDAWNISYTTQNTVGVWIGNTKYDKKYDVTVTGSTLPTIFSRQIYKSIDAPVNTNFYIPYSVVEAEIDTFAQNKQQKILLSNKYTPEIYKKRCYFSIRNCPTVISPYFDLSKIIVNYNLVNSKIAVSIEQPNDVTYNYKIIETNLLNSTKKEYSYIKEREIHLTNNSIFSYKIAIYHEDVLVGYSPEKLVFT